MNGITWRDIQFAVQLDDFGVSPGVVALVCTLDSWRNQRIERLHDLFDIAATAATEAEARCADLEQRIALLEGRIACAA